MPVAFVKKEPGSSIQQADHSLATLDQSAGRAGVFTFSYVCRSLVLTESERVT